MGLMDGKTALVFGVANKYSLAWGITEALAAEGATIGMSYSMDRLERRVRPLAESVNARLLTQCDVARDSEVEATMAEAAANLGKIDILVHAIAFAETDDLNGDYVDTSRDGFQRALDISVYSLVALARAAQPLMTGGGSILTLTYYGAEKVVPHYNVMGVAKAALEASVRYLAHDLGGQQIRVNAISAGPVKTLSAGAFTGFRDMLRYVGERAPLKRNITQEEVAKAALFLLSDLGSGITGEVMHVDAGYNILGMMEPVEESL